MTIAEAIRILDPETTGETLAEIEYYGGFRGRTAAVQAVSNACILAVEALREQENREWIPVNERLPEDGQSVLTYKNGIYDIQTYEERRNGWASGNWFWSMATVTHWMPLPEPPKEEGT